MINHLWGAVLQWLQALLLPNKEDERDEIGKSIIIMLLLDIGNIKWMEDYN